MRPAPRVCRAVKAQVRVRRADTSKVDRFRSDLSSLIADRLRAEDGFGIVEVMVSAIIVVIISLSTFAALDAAGRTADRNKSRSVAASLAQDDLERLRSVKITELAALGASAQTVGPCAAAEGARCREVPVDGEKYYVRSKGEYLAGTAGSDNCASDDEAPKFLKITSIVSWDSMGTAQPVTSNSLRATPSGTIGDFGSLAVDINGRTGSGQAAIPVTITPDATAAANGGVTTTAPTNDKGCVLFGYIATGRYTVSFSKDGYVLAQNPNAASVSETAVVAADSIASKSYQYDQAGRATVNYRTSSAFGTSTWTGNALGTGFTISQAQLGTPPTKIVNNSALNTASSGFVNFPFTAPYQAWAGVCASNEPPALLPPVTGVDSLTIPPGGTGTATVREFRVRVQVQRRTSTSTSSTTNYGYLANDTKALVKFTPTTPGCTDTVNATWVSNTGSATAGTVTSSYSTWEAVVPWGSYTVCAQFTNTTSNRAKVTATPVGPSASTPAGTTHGSKLLIPYNQTTGYAC